MQAKTERVYKLNRKQNRAIAERKVRATQEKRAKTNRKRARCDFKAKCVTTGVKLADVRGKQQGRKV